MRRYRFRGKVQDPDGPVQEFDSSSVKELIELVFRNLSHPGDWANVPAAIAGTDLLKRINWVCAGLLTALFDPRNPDGVLAQLLQASGFVEFEVLGLEASEAVLYRRYTVEEGAEIMTLDYGTTNEQEAVKEWTDQKNSPTTPS
jgi:hypothetical protein